MVHLAWFANFTAGRGTNRSEIGGASWNGRFHIEMAQALERACFNFLMFEDSLMIPNIYGGSHDAYLRHGLIAPKVDPVPLAALVASATRRIGLVTTTSTLAYPPFLLARLASTIDSLSEGRFGWNVVTSAQDTAAQNFGLDVLPDREERYARAVEYMDLVLQLWNSWEPDVVQIDRERAIHTDGGKVRPVDFAGQYYKCRGPQNCAPSLQRVPTLVQAGGWPAFRYAPGRCGRRRSQQCRKHEGLPQRYTSQARGIGRDPDEIKVLFLATPVLGATTEAAEAAYKAIIEGPSFVERKLATISALTDTDFAEFDIDAALPGKLVTNGEHREGHARRLSAIWQRQDPAGTGDGGTRHGRIRALGRHAR